MTPGTFEVGDRVIMTIILRDAPVIVIGEVIRIEPEVGDRGQGHTHVIKVPGQREPYRRNVEWCRSMRMRLAASR